MVLLLLLKTEAWPDCRGEIISGGKSEREKLFVLLALLLPGVRSVMEDIVGRFHPKGTC